MTLGKESLRMCVHSIAIERHTTTNPLQVGLTCPGQLSTHFSLGVVVYAATERSVTSFKLWIMVTWTCSSHFSTMPCAWGKGGGVGREMENRRAKERGGEEERGGEGREAATREHSSSAK